jgi:hypothetical protein
VTSETKRVLGVTTVVVRDGAFVDGKLVEDTRDWYAQDQDGNVWYFGEDTKEYKNGKVTGTAGSWQAGAKGAKPGIIMKARPRVGETYRQEFLKGEAEDMATVLSVAGRATVPLRAFDKVVLTKDFSPIEPDVVEHKFYAPGVGVVLETLVKGGSERLELVSMAPAPS